MKLVTSLILCGWFLYISSGDASGQADWEFLGPDVGYQPDAFFVSQNAIYLGLSEEDETGLGLYRYRFDQGEWELFAWEGYRVTGITVWGEADENILLIRVEPVFSHSAVLRSTDGGSSWIEIEEMSGEASGLTQAPSDTARLIMHFPDSYSTDGGWTWHNPGGGPWDMTSGVSFDPTNPLVVYLAGIDEFSFQVIYKSINGGANWGVAYRPEHTSWGIEVEQAQTDHVMGGTRAHYVIVTTDAGETWSEPEAPFRTKPLYSPPWLPKYFFVAGSNSDETRYEVWRTGDLGETWSPCGDSLPDLAGGELRSAEMYLDGHPTEPILYAALEGSGVWRWEGAAAAAPSGGEEPDGENRLLVYPNPSMNRVTCGVRLSKAEHVVLTLFDAKGRLVRTLRDGVLSAGTHTFEIREDVRNPVSSGIYYITLEAAGSRDMQKIVLVK